MSTLPTVAIIGAGSSGIAAAKALHERDVPFDCFEASDRVGGNWVFENKNGTSAAYRDLHINTSRDRMQFSDFPMPRSLPDFPHHTQIAAYFDDYVDHFGFRDRIRFETLIERAQPRAGRDVAADRRRRGGPRLRHARRRQRPPLGPALARARVSRGRHVRGHPDARPRLPRQRVSRRQGRRRAGHGQQRDGHRRRGKLRRRRDPPRRAARRLDRPEVPLRKAAGPGQHDPARPALAQRARLGGDHPPAHRPARALRPAAPRPPLRRRAPDGVGADPGPHHPRRDRAAAEHRAAGARLGPVHRRHPGACGRRHLLLGLPHHVSVLRRGLPRGARQPPRPLSPGLPAGRSEPRVRRPRTAARRDHADRRGAGAVDRRVPARRVPPAVAAIDGGRHPPRGPAPAPALRRLAAPHDPGRLRHVPLDLRRERRRGAARAAAAARTLPVPARAAARVVGESTPA